MAIEPSTPDLSIHGDTSHPWVDWTTLLAASVMRTQQFQAEALIRWQAAMMEIGNEAWDEWRCRFAGGAPFDA
jgi:hypothetical protein